jgi:hypothetical protein
MDKQPKAVIIEPDLPGFDETERQARLAEGAVMNPGSTARLKKYFRAQAYDSSGLDRRLAVGDVMSIAFFVF